MLVSFTLKRFSHQNILWKHPRDVIKGSTTILKMQSVSSCFNEKKAGFLYFLELSWEILFRSSFVKKTFSWIRDKSPSSECSWIILRLQRKIEITSLFRVPCKFYSPAYLDLARIFLRLRFNLRIRFLRH